MHTTIVITFGLMLLALIFYIGNRLGISEPVLIYSFIGLWLALTVINGAVGIVTADQPLVSELLIGCLVFGVPVAVLVLFRMIGSA